MDTGGNTVSYRLVYTIQRARAQIDGGKNAEWEKEKQPKSTYKHRAPDI